MSNQKILEKAIQKAIDGGWNRWQGSYVSVDSSAITGELFVYFDYLGAKKPKKKSEQHSSIYGVSLSSILLDKDFAKALWGEEEYPTIAGISIGDYSKLPNWKYHLAHMVIAEDPIKYLGENI